MYDEIQQTEKSHSKSSSVEKILVGSLMENTTIKAESDRDYLFVNKDIICVADPCYVTEDDVGKDIFLVDFENAPHGYTLLRQLQRGGAKSVIGGCLIKKDKGLYLSSDLFMNTVEPGSYLGQRERNGPALTMKDSLSKILLWFYKNAKTKSKPNYDVDIVNAFPCKMPVPLKTWARRIRNKHWPSPVVVNEVLLLPVYVVPASQVGTENTDLQWRVSFTRQETHLIQTFSNTQLKVLILAKKIAKYKLRYHCKEITSYVIKNVVFWVFEETPPDQFQVTDLIERLRDVLSQLSDFISKRCLPAYINPDKNLFYGKINATEHNELFSELIKCQSVLTEEFHKCCSRGERSPDEYFGPMFQDIFESLLGPLSQDIMLPHLKELCKDMAETQNVVPQDTENRDKNMPATVPLLESMMIWFGLFWV
ncbi:uncharacterized protein LOC123538307 [Mercenaria mercenaria]|uniref:uncharacterized protein LOC123538307 n=1 Tax=Mercenaria mercenaria TaxID=6596 RepID=UPI00234EDD84|nr:uncharacterized protein LOC123538307 [Mercenaria mercenaria]XP_053386326.1 uncharacterized protein LOC123538307 [Mercenaria mercenaria]